MTTVPRRSAEGPRPARCNLDGGEISPKDQKVIDDFKTFLEAQPKRKRGELPPTRVVPVEGSILVSDQGQFAGEVLGEPVPEGSKVQGFGKSVRNANEAKLKPWRARIKKVFTGSVMLLGPVHVEKIVFVFAPPANWDGSSPPHNRATPDVDKLQRAAFDGLTDAGVWKDDSQVCQMGWVEKCWVGQEGAPLDEPGMYVAVRALSSPQR